LQDSNPFVASDISPRRGIPHWRRLKIRPYKRDLFFPLRWLFLFYGKAEFAVSPGSLVQRELSPLYCFDLDLF
jgi:hypothetical protein